MANADVIYAIAVQGASDAVAAFNNVGVASKKATEETSTSVNRLGTQANTLADAFKKVSRDIGTVGGQAAQTFTHMADEALSVVGLIGGGGMAAAITGIGLAVGGIVLAVRQWNKETEDAKKAIVEQEKAFSDLVKTSKEWYEKGTEATKKRNAEELRALAIQKDLLVVAAEQKLLQDKMASADKGTVDRMLATADAEAAVKKAQAERDKAWSNYVLTQTKELNKEVTRITLDEQDERARKQKEKNERDAASFVDFANVRTRALATEIALMDPLRRAYALLSEEARKVGADETWSDLSGDIERADKATVALGAAMPGLGGMMMQATQAVERYHGAGAQMENQSKRNAEALKNEKDAAEKLRKELAENYKQIKKTLALDLPSQVFSETFSAGMFVVSNATSFASSQLKEFGNINRDNWRDVLSMTEDKKAAFLAEAQSALFSMGVQAGTKAIFETAESFKEGALALGSAAMGDGKGAALHAMSAAGHVASSMAYGTISAAGVGASFAVGAMRGNGGIAPATPGGNAARGGGEARGGGGGGSTGGSTSPGGGSVNITYVYEAGSINAADERATARTVANGVGSARGSWFERRRMERRV